MPRLAPAASPTATLEMLGAKYIRNLFQNSYPGNLNASPVVGYLNAQLSKIDARFAESAGFSDLPGVDCFSEPPKTFTADLSAVIDPTMKITLPDLQCAVVFTPSTNGSGEVFGSDGQGNTSQWIAFAQMPTGEFANTGGFLSYANVTHFGSTDPTAPEEVDGMLASYEPMTSSGSFGSATRFKASSTAGTFELFFASNSGEIPNGPYGPNGPVYLGDGFRMISDGTLIYADGVLLDFDNMSEGMQPFRACIAASTLLPTANLSDCDALAATFTFATTPSLDYCDIVGAGAGCTIPVPAPFNTVPMAPSVVAAINAIFPLSARPSGIPIINNAN